MDKKRIVAEMVDELLKRETFAREELAAIWSLHPATFGELLSNAFDILREQYAIEYRPIEGGQMRRATYAETANRSVRQRRAGLKKLQRSVVRMEIAASAAPSEERERLQKRADVQRFQLANARSRDRRRLSPE